MPRVIRTDVGDYVYHVLNRANARVQIFDDDSDYYAFENILIEGVKKFDMRLLVYCIMPNHWHLILYPKQDGDLSMFMGWLTNTHTRRWHTTKKTIGEGHLYQGRYKSFICETEKYLLTLAKYVEANAKNANLCRDAQEWRWSSLYIREYGNDKQKKMLADWPIDVPKDYLLFVNQKQNQLSEETIESCIIRNCPFGSYDWTKKIIKDFGLEQTTRRVGRPKNGG